MIILFRLLGFEEYGFYVIHKIPLQIKRSRPRLRYLILTVYGKIILMSSAIKPEQGIVVVEFPMVLPTVVKDHDSLTYGKVIAVNEKDVDKAYLLGKTAYWRKYKDDARIDNDHALIEIKDIMGSK